MDEIVSALKFTHLTQSIDLASIPINPGVYIFKDSNSEIIYIGKAINLKSRVRHYFQAPSGGHLASQIIRDKAKGLEWIVTENEVEALILEANLVRKHQPKYNILLKDGKHFPYLKVTTSEPFPRLIVVRSAPRTGDLYFGPYTNQRALRSTLKWSYQFFKIRDCDLKLPLNSPIAPCLSYHIHRCDGPCANLVESSEYRKGVDRAVLMLKGQLKELEVEIGKGMELASANEEYEKAAQFRDQLGDMRALWARQKVDLGDDDAQPRDLVAVSRSGRIGVAVILEIREGVVCERRQFELNCPLEQDENEITTDFLKNYYAQGRMVPREILLSHQPTIEENLQSILSAMRNGAVDLHVPQKGAKRRQVDMALENAKLCVMEALARKEAKNRQDYRVQALQEDLQLAKIPTRIEGFDISHLSGTGTVASNVVFIDGKPAKKEYRKYNVKTVEGIDDFASMREVLGRRARRMKEDNVLPDLILIDGGKGQLSAAFEIMKNEGLEDVPMIGLAKRLEEIFFPGESEPLLLPKTSAALQLLQHIRDESHRFAVTFQRSKRQGYLEESWLDKMEGVGKATKMKLLRAFKSPAEILKLSEAEIAAVVGKAMAKKIVTKTNKENKL